MFRNFHPWLTKLPPLADETSATGSENFHSCHVYYMWFDTLSEKQQQKAKLSTLTQWETTTPGFCPSATHSTVSAFADTPLCP